MKPPKAVASSEDLSKTVSTLFGCTVSSAKAGWFTAVFPPESGTGEARRVHLVLLPFLWTDPSPSRPKDLGMAGTDGAETELPDDEFAAAKELGQRIAWLAELADTAPKYVGEAPLLPARRPGARAARAAALAAAALPAASHGPYAVVRHVAAQPAAGKDLGCEQPPTGQPIRRAL